MSQTMTTTARQENPIRGDSPMEIDRHTFQHDTRQSARASTTSSSLSPPPELHEQEEAARQRAMSMAKNRAASEKNANANANANADPNPNARMNDIPLRISTTEPPRPILHDEAQACTCSPSAFAPSRQAKIPRPRNSFILYRSNKQTETINENPGLSNPQISKIIGEKWANESPEVKEKFQKMAAQEAERHKLEHPGYTYKPKRKGSTTDANTPRSYYTDGERCTTCNGFRMIPLSNYRGSGKFDTDSPSVARFEAPKRPYSQLKDEEGQRLERRRSSSPNPKRRRLPDTADSQGVAPIQVRQIGDKMRGQGQHGRLPASAGHDGRYVHVDTPRHMPHNMAPPPPPRAHPGPGHLGSAHPGSAHPGSAHPQANKSGYHYADVDASVRLPPLKTAISPSQPPVQQHGMVPQGLGITPSTAASAHHIHDTRSTIEQIRAITFSRRQASLNRICPRLSLSVTKPRGAIIAVEGSDQRTVEQVSVAVERTLICCREAVVTAWSHSPFINHMSLPPQGEDFNTLAPAVFKDILAWHIISSEITNFVTKKWISKSPNGSVSSARQSPAGDHGRSASEDDANKIPVALIKNGYTMTLSERVACATSNNLGHYSPLDHWQWMATLWRGIVGQDLMVYVKPCNQEDMEKLKSVEYSPPLRVMIVRVPYGKGMSEATERRLNFEIIEWITDVWPKEAGRTD